MPQRQWYMCKFQHAHQPTQSDMQMNRCFRSKSISTGCVTNTLNYDSLSMPITVAYTWWVHETRVFQAANGEDLVILACTVFDWSTRVTERQTNRQTDGRTDKIAMANMRWKMPRKSAPLHTDLSFWSYDVAQIVHQ